MASNKEVYHEGWLIKSPPTKRIWRARWRRRWFTLKQGELPGQFFLEYYTDRKCRKLKGIIDLDQCEQVDAGLRLDRQKEKYAHMFDVKTPMRTYFLAADTEEDMRGWVNCICQVCNLQETQTVDDRPYYNIGAINMMAADAMAGASTTVVQTSQPDTDISNDTTETMVLNYSTAAGGSATGMADFFDPQQPSHGVVSKHAATVHSNPYGTYQNEEMLNSRAVDYTNRETIICDVKLSQSHPSRNSSNLAEAYSNLGTIERSQSLRGKPEPSSSLSSSSSVTAQPGPGQAPFVSHMRTQSLNSDQRGKKIPENLKLTDRSVANNSAFDSGPEQPSPALSTSSGPYIPISECYSGSPITPLNSLDPRFYDTPRSHTIVGYNLTNNEQPYSPKRNNVGGVILQQQQQKQQQQPPPAKVSLSGKSSPSDSESVFTDDEWSGSGMVAGGGTMDRSTRPSDSSIENDAVGWTYVQRFSKVPNAEERSVINAPPRPPKRASLNLDAMERHKDIHSSDTENVSPAIGPKDASSCVEQFYDIPRSHQHPYTTGSNMHLPDGELLSPLNHCDLVASSTPNLISEVGSQCGGTLGRQRPHCYTNAAPTKIEGNVFRFDFNEQADAPAINRSLKPKSTIDISKSVESVSQAMKTGLTFGTQPSGGAGIKSPPTVDRTRKPATPKVERAAVMREERTLAARGGHSGQQHPATGSNTMRRKGGPVALNLQNHVESMYGNTQDSSTSQLTTGISPRTPGKNDDRLQYLDLDHSNSPQKPSGAVASIAPGPASIASSVPHGSGNAPSGSSVAVATASGTTASGTSVPVAPPVARTPYTTVDFVKTDAFNRIRADSELTRAQSRLKDQS